MLMVARLQLFQHVLQLSTKCTIYWPSASSDSCSYCGTEHNDQGVQVTCPSQAEPIQMYEYQVAAVPTTVCSSLVVQMYVLMSDIFRQYKFIPRE